MPISGKWEARIPGFASMDMSENRPPLKLAGFLWDTTQKKVEKGDSASKEFGIAQRAFRYTLRGQLRSAVGLEIVKRRFSTNDGVLVSSIHLLAQAMCVMLSHKLQQCPPTLRMQNLAESSSI